LGLCVATYYLHTNVNPEVLINVAPAGRQNKTSEVKYMTALNV